MQVETVAQFGVIFLLFALGLEFSATKVYLYCCLHIDIKIHILIDMYYLLKIHIILFNLQVQLRVVRAVAVLGGLLQIFLFMCLCGLTASVRLNIIVKTFKDLLKLMTNVLHLKFPPQFLALSETVQVGSMTDSLYLHCERYMSD